MEKDFEDFIVKRCSSLLSENEEYKELMMREHDLEEELDLAMRLCYRRGFTDCQSIMLCSQKL